jgi:hypothetical protein
MVSRINLKVGSGPAGEAIALIQAQVSGHGCVPGGEAGQASPSATEAPLAHL